MDRQELLTSMYTAMLAHFGEPQVPTFDSPFDAMLGISLGLSPEALQKISANFPLEPERLFSLSLHELDALFPSSKKVGSKKSAIVHDLLHCLAEYSYSETFTKDLSFLRDISNGSLQEQLISIRGIGRETADALLLYALDRPVFVTSSAIFRILRRHGLAFEGIEQSELQNIFMDVLPKHCSLYKQFGMLLSSTARNFCKTAQPACKRCPLNTFLEYEPVD